MTHLGGGDTGRTAAFWLMSSIVVLVTAAAAALASVLHEHVLVEDLRSHGGFVIAASSGVFLVAASLRLAIYLLTGRGEARTRAVATAVVALVLMPVHLWSHSFVDTTTASADELAAIGAGRAVSAVVVVALLLLAVARPRRNDRLYVVAGASWSLALALLALGACAAWWPTALVPVQQVLSLLTAALWGAVAGYAAHRTGTRPWAAGMAPFLLLMGMTEVLLAIDPAVPGRGATAAALIATLLAAVALLRALADLRSTIRAEQRRVAELERDLLTTRDDLAALQQRERRLAHDARGTLAGVRAAMQIWASAPYPAAKDALEAASQLRRAALCEVERLEDALREHRVELGCGPLPLDLVVERATRAALARGAEIRVRVPALVVRGQATDLELALREVVDRFLLDDPSQDLAVTARCEAASAVLEVTPGSRRKSSPRRLTAVPDQPDSGLARAQLLMRRQGGHLVDDHRGAGVRLVITLCPPVPQQRSAPAEAPALVGAEAAR